MNLAARFGATLHRGRAGAVFFDVDIGGAQVRLVQASQWQSRGEVTIYIGFPFAIPPFRAVITVSRRPFRPLLHPRFESMFTVEVGDTLALASLLPRWAQERFADLASALPNGHLRSNGWVLEYRPGVTSAARLTAAMELACALAWDNIGRAAQHGIPHGGLPMLPMGS